MPAAEVAAAFLPGAIAPLTAALLIGAAFFTSALTAAFGIGGGVALLALMTYAMPVAALVPVHGAVQLSSNAGRVWVLRTFLDWRAILPFVAGSAVGALAGAQFVVQLPEALLQTILAVFIIAVTWISLPALPAARKRLFSAVFAGGGAVNGFATMFVGATGPLTALFFEKVFADRRAYSANHAAAMVAQHGFKIVAFALAGFAFFDWLGLIVAMSVLGYAGTVVGAAFLARLPEDRFRRWFRIVLTVLALDLLRRGLSAL